MCTFPAYGDDGENHVDPFDPMREIMDEMKSEIDALSAGDHKTGYPIYMIMAMVNGHLEQMQSELENVYGAVNDAINGLTSSMSNLQKEINEIKTWEAQHPDEKNPEDDPDFQQKVKQFKSDLADFKKKLDKLQSTLDSIKKNYPNDYKKNPQWKNDLDEFKGTYRLIHDDPTKDASGKTLAQILDNPSELAKAMYAWAKQYNDHSDDGKDQGPIKDWEDGRSDSTGQMVGLTSAASDASSALQDSNNDLNKFGTIFNSVFSTGKDVVQKGQDGQKDIIQNYRSH